MPAFDPLAAGYIGAYLLFSGLLPLANKAIFSIFPFPVTATVIQICAVAAFLLVMTGCTGSHSTDRYGSTWTKARLLLLPAMFFAGNISLTNLGIHLTDVNVHILLRASELIWVLLLGVAVKLEPCPPRGTIAACAVLMLGVILVSCGAGGEVGASAVGITLLSALFSACHVITIRRAMTAMMEFAHSKVATEGLEQVEDQEGADEQMGLLSSPERLADQQGGKRQRSDQQRSTPEYDSDRCRNEEVEQPNEKLPSGKVPELLMLKMMLSMVFLVPAAVLEHVRLKEASSDAVTAWAVLATPESTVLMGGMYFSRSCAIPALAVGVLFTLLFQGMMLAMATRIRALSIGFVAQCKVLPDYAVSLLAGGQTLLICGCDSNPQLRCPSYRRETEDITSVFFWLHAVGAILVLSGALMFARLRKHTTPVGTRK